jgi:hypothetical protein
MNIAVETDTSTGLKGREHVKGEVGSGGMPPRSGLSAAAGLALRELLWNSHGDLIPPGAREPIPKDAPNGFCEVSLPRGSSAPLLCYG